VHLAQRVSRYAILTAVGAVGCGAGWHGVPVTPRPVEARQQVQVWHQGRVEQWHAVVVTPESLSGIPFHRPVTCDSCRMAFSRAAIDSVRFGNPVAGFWKTTALLIAAPFVIVEVICAAAGDFPNCWPSRD
jgi:hypothetical protein